MEKAYVTNTLRLSGRAKNRATPIQVHVTFGAVIQGLMDPYGYLSLRTIESRVCDCCSLNHGKCERRKVKRGVKFSLPQGIKSSTVRKKAICLTKRMIS